MRSVKYFGSKIIANKYKVVPPPEVPLHIPRPSYLTEHKPVFGVYNGPPVLHNAESIIKMRKAAKVASNTLRLTEQYIQDSYTTLTPITEEDIDRFVFNTIIAQNAYPTPIGFMHFPKSVCVSSNDCIVHGIPSVRPVEAGDKINIDVTVFIGGVHGDTNLTVIYGEALHEHVAKVVRETQQAMYQGISMCRPGSTFKSIGQAIEGHAKKQGLHVCEYFTGHGVGSYLHMPPQIHHTEKSGLEVKMQVGNIFTIEPIMTLVPTNERNLSMWDDEFTMVSPNNPNAQFEHTILIVPEGCEVLTKREGENIPNPFGNIQ